LLTPDTHLSKSPSDLKQNGTRRIKKENIFWRSFSCKKMSLATKTLCEKMFSFLMNHFVNLVNLFVSGHLGILKDVRIVTEKKNGFFLSYLFIVDHYCELATMLNAFQCTFQASLVNQK